MTAKKAEPGAEPLQNHRHELFAQLYCGECKRVGADAARKAGYSERTAGQTAYEILKRPEVSSRIAYLTKQFWLSFKMGPEETAARISMAARPDIRLLFNEDGGHKLPHELDDLAASMVIGCETELKFDDDGSPPTAVRKYRLRSADPSLRILAQHHKMIGADVNINITDLASRMERARKRVKERA